MPDIAIWMLVAFTLNLVLALYFLYDENTYDISMPFLCHHYNSAQKIHFSIFLHSSIHLNLFDHNNRVLSLMSFVLSLMS